MERLTLHEAALAIIEQYRQLPCPYVVNRRQLVHGAFGTLVGKGSPGDIREEATMIALKEKIDTQTMDTETFKRFLADHRLGIDCSGFVYYTLDAECFARGKRGLGKSLAFPCAKGLRKLIVKLRPAENTDVATLADDANSMAIALMDVAPGDILIFLGAGQNHDRDHVLLVHAVETENGVLKTIRYAHSFQWSVDGKYGHGIKEGAIEISDASLPLIGERWVEAGKTDEENETFRHAREAKRMEIRRLRALV